VFERARRLAGALFGGGEDEAAITLVGEDGAWCDCVLKDLPPEAPGTRWVVDHGELLWVEDASKHPLYANYPMVTAAPHMRLYVAAPIRLDDGTIPGVLAIGGREPRSFDQDLADRLQDIADFVADEWTRVRATEARELSARERDVAHRTLAAIVESAPVSVALTDRDLRLTHASPIWLEDQALTPQEVIGRSLHEIAPEMFAPWRKVFDRCLAGETIQAEKARVPRPDGGTRLVNARIAPWRDAEGEVGGLIIVSHDMTELYAAFDRAEAANRAKSAFLATVSHEIRTPLNGLMGMVQAMARGELDPVQRERLDVLRTCSEGLLSILNELLDHSKVEAGKLTLEEGELDIGELAQAACATFQAVADNKGVTLAAEVSRAARGRYRGDPMRVRQVLHNLVSNALKFTDEGAVRIIVSRRGGQLQLEVADSGIGMSPEQQERLFRAFQQADASTSRVYGGTGLGLAICRDLVELMGGAISVRSAAGKGTRFTVRLPLVKLEGAGPAACAPRREEEARSADRGVRVLAAEDNAVNQLVLKTLLDQAGIEPVIVGDGRAAVEAWAREPWDLILMDVQMPGLDGPSATAEIRAREKAEGRRRTPIIALTANAMDDQVAQYLAAGMDGHVAKPISASQLFAAVQAALSDEAPAGSEAAA
jgi:PAS domain S-box-containing protein